MCSRACLRTHVQVENQARGEILMVNVGSTSTGGNVRAVKADLAKIELTVPMCTQARDYNM